MASKAAPLTPPTLVRIVHSPYDSDNEEEYGGATSPNSFVHPLSEAKKARARGGSKKITFLDEISWNAVGIGQSMAVQANHSLQRLVAPAIDDNETEGYESDDDSQQLWRKSNLDKLMGMALDRADMYATALCNVTDRVPVPSIGNGFICGDDEYSEESWSSHEEDRPRRERYNRTKKSRRPKKKASSAVPYNGHLSDSLSISSDDVSYTFEDPTHLSPSKHTRVTTGTPCPKAASLRQRREEFMRRKDSSIEATTYSRSNNIKRPEIIKLRAKHFYSQRAGNFERDRSYDECDKLYGESIPDPDLAESYSTDLGEKSYNYKWQSNSAMVDIPNCDSIFFMSSHLGPSILRVPLEMGNSLQMGDIMLRVDGKDVSSTEGSVVENILKSMRGKRVQVSFLRKRMSA